jgi:AcrR family transcriptional regulator
MQPARQEATQSPPQSLGRSDWIEIARKEFIAGGVDAVKIGRLACRLRVTRGSFYWHFTSREDLLQGLLSAWELSSVTAFERSLLDEGARSGPREFLIFAGLWVKETDFVPAYDTAVRDWARTSAAAAAAVRRVDQRRIEILHRIFRDLGFAEPEALVRARISYFHQVGYYAVGLPENRQRRLALVPIYLQVLSGLPMELIVAELGLET